MQLPTRIVTHLTGAAVIALGVTVLCGWAFHIEVLKSIVPGSTTLKPPIALAFLLIGVTLNLLSCASRNRWAARMAAVVTGLALVLGLLELGQNLFDFDTGVDQILFSASSADTPHANVPVGRMTVQAAIQLVLLSGALLLLALRRSIQVAQGLAVIALIIPLLILLGYLFGSLLFAWLHYKPMGVHLAIGFLLAAVGTLIIALEDDFLPPSLRQTLPRLIVAAAVGMLAIATGALIFDLWTDNPITFFSGHGDTHIALGAVFLVGVGALLFESLQLDAHSSSAQSPTSHFLLSRQVWLPLWVMVICLTITHLARKEVQHDAMRDLQTDFNSRAADIFSRVEHRMDGYAQILRGAQGYVNASSHIDQRSFETYVASLHLRQEYPGIQALHIVRIIPANQKDAHIAAMRKTGLTQYAIEPAGKRAFYCPVLYVAPLTIRDQQSLGFDACYGEARVAAKEQARDLDDVVLSGKVVLHRDQVNNAILQPSDVMSIPIFKPGAPKDTLADRRANILGWVTATFHVSDLMTGILGTEHSDLDVEVYDGTEMSDQTLLYDYDGIRGETKNMPIHLKAVRQIICAHHTWTVAIYPIAGFEARLDTHRATLVSIAGIVVSLLLTLLSWVLVYTREFALQTARKLNRELIQNIELLRTTLESVDMGFAVWSAEQYLVLWNRRCPELWEGFSDLHVGTKRIDILRHIARHGGFGPGDPETLANVHYQRILEGEPEDEFTTINGRIVHVTRHMMSDGGYAAVYMDVTQRRLAEKQMQYLAHYDSLTTLPNRALLLDRLQQAIIRSLRNKTRMAVLYLDLDRFKPVNDTFGHAIGDQLLKQVASRLLRCVRASDTVARLGGDEFVVLLPNTDRREDIAIVADKILAALNTPFTVADHILHISSSVGIAIYPDHGDNDKLLLINADIAMYHSKSAGRNSFRFYPDMPT